MEVISEVFLEEGNKRVTIFSVVPQTATKEIALSMLQVAVNELMSTKLHAVYYNQFDNPYSLIVVEGLMIINTQKNED